MIRQKFVIANMHCANCAMSINWAAEDLDGVEECNTSFAQSQAEISYDPGKVTVDDILAAIRSAGYEARRLE